MTHITEHHAEEEGERDDRQQGWVSLQVARYAIRVNDLLVHAGHVIRLDAGWPLDVVPGEGGDAHSGEAGEARLNQVLLLSRSPEEADACRVLHLHHVFGQTQGLLFGEEHLVDVDGAGRGLTPLFVAAFIDGTAVALLDAVELPQLVAEAPTRRAEQ